MMTMITDSTLVVKRLTKAPLWDPSNPLSLAATYTKQKETSCHKQLMASNRPGEIERVDEPLKIPVETSPIKLSEQPTQAASALRKVPTKYSTATEEKNSINNKKWKSLLESVYLGDDLTDDYRGGNAFSESRVHE